MDLIWLKLTAGRDGHGVTEQTLIDILWASARPEDQVEHISVRARDDPPGLLVAVFVRAGPPDAARTAGLRVAHAAIATSPTLAGWSVRLAGLGPPEPPQAAGRSNP